MRAIHLAGAGLLLAAGCAIGPSTRVAPPAPVSARIGDSLTAPVPRRFLDSLATARDQDRGDTASAALWKPRALTLDSASDRPWLQVLRDSQLVALVETALRNNKDLQVAEARVREYRALAGVARSDLFPQLAANFAASKNELVFGAFPPQKFDVVRLTGDLAWELDFWGRLRRQAQAGTFDRQGREEEERAAVVTLVSDVATAYLELRELDQELAISERTLESRRASLDLARRRFAQGVISELDVRQFEAQAAEPAARVAEFAQQRAIREHQLSVLLGRSPGPVPRGNPLEATVQAVAVPDSIPADLLFRRPDVRQAERDLQAATARVGLAIGNRLPRVMLTGSYGRQSGSFHDLFGSSPDIYLAQAGISLPLFTGGKLLDQQRAARARADQARGRYEQAVLRALQEADDALAGLRLSRDQLVALETQERALARAFALANERYQSGVSSYLEVLDAQRSLYTAQLALAGQTRQYLGATVQLYKALGGGWAGAAGGR
jgi:multidrug efflux system outer membrane protein